MLFLFCPSPVQARRQGSIQGDPGVARAERDLPRREAKETTCVVLPASERWGGGAPAAYWLWRFQFQLQNELRDADFPGDLESGVV